MSMLMTYDLIKKWKLKGTVKDHILTPEMKAMIEEEYTKELKNCY